MNYKVWCQYYFNLFGEVSTFSFKLASLLAKFIDVHPDLHTLFLNFDTIRLLVVVYIAVDCEVIWQYEDILVNTRKVRPTICFLLYSMLILFQHRTKVQSVVDCTSRSIISVSTSVLNIIEQWEVKIVYK